MARKKNAPPAPTEPTYLQIRLTREQKRQLERAAQASGFLAVSEWARFALLDKSAQHA
jgi:uncharacterized protein (DUF1778 family)